MRLGQLRLRVHRKHSVDVYWVRLTVSGYTRRPGEAEAAHQRRLGEAKASHPDLAAALAHCVEAMRPLGADGRR
jgi:hypothetical protein